MGGIASIFKSIFSGPSAPTTYTPVAPPATSAASPSASAASSPDMGAGSSAEAQRRALRQTPSTVRTSASGAMPSGTVALKSLLGE